MSRAILIRGYLLAVLSCLLWSTNFTVARAIRDLIGPFTITAIRTVLAAALLLPFVRGQGGLREFLACWRMWVACAITGVVGTSGFSYWALHYTLAVNAALINGTAPLFTIVLGRLFLHEPIGLLVGTGFALSFAGIIWIVSHGNLAVLLGFQVNIGDTMYVFVVTLWAAYSILGRKVMAQTPTTMFTGYTMLAALPFVLLMGTWEVTRQGWPAFTWTLAGVILYLTLVNSVGSYLLWNEAVRLIGPTRVAITYNTIPLFGTLVAIIALGEPLAAYHLVGGLLVVLGSLLGVRGTDRPRAGDR